MHAGVSERALLAFGCRMAPSVLLKYTSMKLPELGERLQADPAQIHRFDKDGKAVR